MLDVFNMKLSIITPCKNRAIYLPETINSVCNQSINKKQINFEIEYIIIDGNSNDETKSLLENYKKKYPFIKFISEKDNGMYDALSKGFDLATGDIITYLNAGDFYNYNCFDIIYKIFNNYPKVNWMTGGKYIYNNDSHIIHSSIPFKYRNKLILSGVYGRYLPFIQQESTFWRRKLNKLIDFEKFKKLKFAGDYFIWHSFAKEEKLHIVQSHLGGFKIHPNQLSATNLKGDFNYMSEVKSFCEKNNIYNFFLILIDLLPWFINKYSALISAKLSNHITYENDKWKFYNENISNDKVYAWYCDASNNRGEGKLLRLFLNSKYKKNQVIICSFNKQQKLDDFKLDSKKKTDNLSLSFTQSYIYPFIGLLWCWKKFLLRQKYAYVNFLPLWNTILIAFLPPNTILGPITGSLYNGKVINLKTFVRKFLIPILYYINSRILFLRKDLIFSTSMLKKFLPKKMIENADFDFIEKTINVEKYNTAKDIDLIIYYRKYDTKSNEIIEKLVDFSIKKNLNYFYFGDKINNVCEKYLGILPNTEVHEFLKRSKFSFITEENVLSIFATECINQGVNLFISKENSKFLPEKLKHSKKIISLNYKNFDEASKKILETIKEFDNKYNYSYFF